MIESTYHIEEVFIKRGEITFNKEKIMAMGMVKMKVNIGTNVVNDEVVHVPKTKEPIFWLMLF